MRMITSRPLTATSLLLAILSVAILTSCRGRQGAGDQPRLSAFGVYHGYADSPYDGIQRTSDYLTMADGTKLAWDLYLPTSKGAATTERLPVLFKYTPYDRAWTVFAKDGNDTMMDFGYPWYGDVMLRFRRLIMGRDKGGIKDMVNRTEWLGEMVHAGYAAVVIDRPGTGASFGAYQGDPAVVAKELDELMDWIAAQPWSNGKIGMFGDSIQAQVQFRAASTGNPHLKAIFPATTWMDNYSAVMFPGGIPNKAMASFYAKVNNAFEKMATPVDRDKNGTLLAQARAERGNKSVLGEGVSTLGTETFREGDTWLRDQTLYPLIEKINHYGVPVYLINGWYDIYARDNFFIYNNLTVPKRLMVRPTDHAGIEATSPDVNYAAEAHRWFDYWLKGIDNGILKDPPIHYFLQNVQKPVAWQTADAWPLSAQQPTRFYLAPGSGKTAASANNGALALARHQDATSFDEYSVDYSTTTGRTPHWTGLALPHRYPNMRSNDAKALTYTTPALSAPLSIVGHPLMHIWLSTNAPDLDMFAYLETVDAGGNSTYVSQGELRATHRALAAAPFETFGLPWHSYARRDLQPVEPGKPFELVFDLLPTAWQFTKGSRVRITVAFADAGNFDTPVLTPPPTVRLLQDKDHPSCVDLPVLRAPSP